jgi:hypothetical protein
MARYIPKRYRKLVPGDPTPAEFWKLVLSVHKVQKAYARGYKQNIRRIEKLGLDHKTYDEAINGAIQTRHDGERRHVLAMVERAGLSLVAYVQRILVNYKADFVFGAWDLSCVVILTQAESESIEWPK